MKIPSRYALLMVLSLLWISVSLPVAVAQEAPPSPTGPQLVGTYPLPGAAFTDQIVFYFDRPLAPTDNLDALIAFEPPLSGTWTQGERHLAFTLNPDRNVEKRIFRATLLDSLVGPDGRRASAPENPLHFTDFTLTVDRFEYERIGLNTTELNLVFSTAVSWDQVAQHIRITDRDQAEVAYSSVRKATSSLHRLTVPTIPTAPYTLHVTPGLTESSGVLQTDQAIIKTVPEHAPFTIESVTWHHHTAKKDRIEVKLNHAQTPPGFLRSFSVYGDESETPLKLTYTGKDEAHQLTYRFDRPSVDFTRLRYAFAANLPDLPPIYTQKESGGEVLLSRENLQIQYHNWNSEGVEPLTLQLFFNGSVDPDALTQHLSIAPEPANLTYHNGDNGSVELRADWQSGVAYRIMVSQGLTDRANTLRVNQAQAWNPGKAPKRSGVGFAFESPYYFPRRTAGPLPVYGRNLKKAEATLYELYPSNLVQALQQMEGGKSSSQFGYELSKKLSEHTITFTGGENERLEAALPLADFMPDDRKGIFGIALSPAYDYYNTKIIVWTDIGVLAHWQDDALLLYAHNLWDLSPIAEAKVTVYSQKHQVMGEVTTDANGVAHLEHWDSELGNPRVAIVETADDFTFLPLNERGEDPVAFNYGMPSYDPDGYDAFLYADRNLYRPGETMHLRWLVRQADGTPLTDAPLSLRLYDEKGGKRTFTESLSHWGSGTLDVETKRDWLTGAYRVELWVPGAPSPLTTQTINLEDFVPNRLAAEVKTAAPYWLPGEEHTITVHGDHLSGGPARERKSSAFVILEKGAWKPEQWPDYTFTNESTFNTDVRELGESNTDELGDATFTFTWNPPKDLSFPLSATVRGEVFESGGRSVAARTEATFFPTDIVVGLAVAPGTASNAVDVSVVATGANGQAASLDTVQVTLEKKQWRYYVRRYSSHNEANWNDDFAIISSHTVPLSGGVGTVTVPVPEGYGTYRVKVHRENSPQYATQSFWSYRGQAHLADATRPSLIELTPDKKTYTIGDTATVQITSPFDGDAIVVVQHETLEKLVTVPITNGVGTLSLPLEAGHYPNVWLETTVIHPVEPGTALTYPYASFAMVNLPVHDPTKALTVTLPDLPKVTRPAATIPVTVQVANPDGTPVAAELTLALVDEGIHQILRYETPDPVAWFQRTRRPLYRRAHYYDQVAYDFTGKPIGGGALLKKRLGEDDSNVDDNWIKPLALWSGVVETDATGVATIEMDLPEFAGKVRLVAVATTGTEAGSTGANMVIRRPVVLQTTLPRFAAPGDTFQATALLQNKTDAPLKSTLSVSTTEPVVAAPFTASWDIPAGDEVVVPIPLGAGEFPGSGNILWKLESTDSQGAVVDAFETNTPLKIQAPSVYQVRNELVLIPPGEQRDFANTEFRDNDRLEGTLQVTPNPLARLQKALDYVIAYPYGCAEQTTSRCMPLFLLGQTANQIGDDWEAQYFRQFIQAGIDRLFSMQNRDGGMGYWPGARESYPYGSIYAAHFLTLAKGDPAFNVPEEGHTRLMTYLRERVPLEPGHGNQSYYNYAYACFVRALAQDPEVMSDITRLDTFNISTTARQWLLLAQLRFTNAPDQGLDYLLTHPSTPYDVREQGETLNSTVRNDAITLMTQMALGAESDLIQPQAEKLIRYLENHRYSTQEAAFIITALAEYLKKNVGNLSEAQATIATPDGVETHTGAFQFKTAHKGAGTRYTVANEGTAPLYVNLSWAGILLNPEVQAASNGIKLSRQFESPGAVVDPATLEHGKTYLVSVEITCAEDMKNVVLVDLLPGGLDIENPRLTGDALGPWKKTDGVQPSYIDVRDDRLIAAFDHLRRGTHRYYYAVRTVTAGTFQQPGTNAECMYAIDINGRTAPSSVTIAP